MAIYIPSKNLMFLHVLKCAGMWITNFLATKVKEEVVSCGAMHSRLSDCGMIQICHPKTFAFFRKPSDWLESYFTMKMKHSQEKHDNKWFIYEPETAFHPTWELDMICQSFDINKFATKLLQWDKGFFKRLFFEWYNAEYDYDSLKVHLEKIFDEHELTYDKKELYTSPRINFAEGPKYRLQEEIKRELDLLI